MGAEAAHGHLAQPLEAGRRRAVVRPELGDLELGLLDGPAEPVRLAGDLEFTLVDQAELVEPSQPELHDAEFPPRARAAPLGTARLADHRPPELPAQLAQPPIELHDAIPKLVHDASLLVEGGAAPDVAAVRDPRDGPRHETSP